MDINQWWTDNLWRLVAWALDRIQYLVGWMWENWRSSIEWLAHQINPFFNYGDAVLYFSQMLPAYDPNTPYFLQSLASGGTLIIGYLSLLSYFVDLNAFIMMIGFLAAAESGLITYRAWMTLKRAIPLFG